MRKLSFALVAALVVGLGTFIPATPVASATTQPKVAIIVGATHSVTAKYRLYANEVYNEAIKFTPNVVKVYSPNATWSKVKSAVNGASIVVYLGHGNGWPSPYTYDPNYTTKNGFGLNYDNNGDGQLSDYENRYYGEPSIRTLTPARNAVVLLFHLCYASGNSEPGHADPSLSTAKQRVDNYAAAFIQAGARAVIANGHSHHPYYINALFTTRQTIDEYWRNAPDFRGNVKTYESTRNPGYTYQLDPESAGRYYRSIAGRMTLTTQDVTGASYASTSGDPATFVVPGNASTTADEAPIFDSPEAAALGVPVGEVPARTIPAIDTKIRIAEQAPTPAWDGSTIFRVRTDTGIEGWMTSTHLRPRDSLAPRAWSVDEGVGAFSPNNDGVQDTWALAAELSESADWSVRLRSGSGSTIATKSGSGTLAQLAWAPKAGSVPDGTYGWRLEAVDAWGNGPLVVEGSVEVDTLSPSLALADAEAESIPVFTPNGDGSRETISFAAGSSEPGTISADVTNEAGAVVDTASAKVSTSPATITWDGRTSAGYLPDGRYTVTLRARDRAGNLSEPHARTVDLYGALGYVTSSKALFFPQDGDSRAKSTTFSAKLKAPATVTWTVVNASGAVVRTFRSEAALGAGTWTHVWNGRNDAGGYVPRGTYRTQVTATNGVQGATQQATTIADAFRITVSDTTPARGQRITVTMVTAETLLRNPRVAVYQPGISSWSVATTKVSSTTYRATLTLRSSAKGTVRIKAYGKDSAGQSQSSSRYLPLH